MRTLVIVPTHNEADNIYELLARVRDHAPEADVLVVDDISTDETRARVNEAAAAMGQIRLECRDRKSGLGDAYRHGFGIGLAAGYDALVEIDADHSHDPSALPMMLSLAAQGIDLVIGSRYIPGGGVPGWSKRRLWLSRWGNRYAAVVLGLAINDATAGYRVYRAETLRSIDLAEIRADGYGFQIEMTYRVVERGLRVVEIPIIFRDRVAGESKMHRRIVIEAFWLITRWGLSDLVTQRRRRRTIKLTAADTTIGTDQ
jgi:glycosyltransferase involved in cell wall biosynthesis